MIKNGEEQTVVPLWKNSKYLKFLSSFTIGNIGDWFDVFALQIVFALDFHASPILIASLWFFYIAPTMLFAKSAGKWADFLPQKIVLISTDILCGLITLAMFFVYKVDLMILLLLLRGTIATMNSPAQQAVTVALVPQKQLLQASSWSAISFQLSRALGPMLGGLMLLTFSARGCLLLNAISFFISFLLVILIKYPQKTLPSKKHNLADQQEKNQFKVWQFIRANFNLLSNFLFFALVITLLMMAMAQAVLLIREVAPHRPQLFGWMTGFSGLGSVLVGFYLSRKQAIGASYFYYIVALGCLGLADILFSCFKSSWPDIWMMLFALFEGGAMGVATVVFNYVLKKESPYEKIGAIAGFGQFMRAVCLAAGVAVSAFWVGWFGAVATFRGIGIVAICLSLVLWLAGLTVLRSRVFAPIEK